MKLKMACQCIRKFGQNAIFTVDNLTGYIFGFRIMCNTTYTACNCKSCSCYAVGTTIPITCRERYMLNGPSTMTCQTGGTWSPAPKCEEIGNLLYLSVYIFLSNC